MPDGTIVEKPGFPTDLNGIFQLLTRTGSGLGTMMATALVQNGARVIIASRKEKQLKEVGPSLKPCRMSVKAYLATAVKVADKLTKEGPGSCE